jgi:hypothetical protein
MLKQMAIAAPSRVAVFAQTPTPAVHYEQLDEIRKSKCKDPVPGNFGCAILFDVDFPSSGQRRNVRLPAPGDGEDLPVQWPDGTQTKGRIIRREKIDPELAQAA